MKPIVLITCLALVGCKGDKSKDTKTGSPKAANAAATTDPGKDTKIEAPNGDQPRAWNEVVLTMAAAEDKFMTLKGLRTTTMMHVAMHDTLNAIDPRYEHYAYTGDGKGADPHAAVAQAAYEVTSSQYTKPEQVKQLEELRDKWLGMAKDEGAKKKGIEIGKAAAAAIIKKREGDGWNAEVQHELKKPTPGVYQEFPEHSGTPEGFVFGAAWAKVRPFAIEKADQFRAPPPPAIESPEYAEAYNEVKEIGAADSKTRTKDQTHTAHWWKDFTDNSLNRLARQLTEAEKLDLWDTARFFSLINMAGVDSYIAIFDNKFHHDHWRPYTAIRAAAKDGNDKTAPDKKWNTAHKHTYPFPSYPSAHGSNCAAMLAAFAKQFGADYEFTMTTPEVNESHPFSPMMKMDPPTRSFKSFSEAADECGLSRVYLGIHFRYDSTEGVKHGTKVGEHVLANYLKPKN